MVNKDWTLEEALKANEAALQENPERTIADPTLPFSQWVGLNQLGHLEDLYREGEKFALMQAIRECARCDLAMPRWVSKAYIRAFDDILNYKSKDWNEVFGSPLKKGANLNALRNQRMLQFDVYLAVCDILNSSPRQPIDIGLFEKVGERFNIGKTLAQKYYYSAKKVLTKDQPDIDKLLLSETIDRNS